MKRKEKGITLISLVITIIVLLILAGVAVNTLIGDNGIINGTISVVERSNIATWKEKIELSIIELISLEDREITIDKIIDRVIEKGITTEENSNKETGQVNTEGGYIYEIKEKEDGSWEVIYIGKGELAKTELSITVAKDISALTTKVTLTIKAKADSGIKSYTSADGTTKTYSNGEKEISETYEIIANGTYTFTVENNKGKSETKEIVIGNILEGTIGMSPSKEEATNENVIVTVVWPAGSEQGIKEIKVGESEWVQYTEEESTVTVEENCTLKARIKSSIGDVTTSTLTITNIDKLVPMAFNPTVTATSNSITVNGSTSDQAATSQYASSGVVAYYFRINGGEWKTNTNLLETSYTFTDLSQGTSYTIEMRAVDKAGNETITKEITQETNTIAGAESITITPSTTAWTNQDITVTVTWPSDTTGLTKQISKDGGSTWSTYTSAVTISSNCTVKARLIDNTNQTGTAASLTISCIDHNDPIVTATSTSASVDEGTNKALSSYFTIQQNGDAPLASTTFYDTSNGNAVVTNTSSLAVGTHVIKCTVIKSNGGQAEANISLTINSLIVLPSAETTLANLSDLTYVVDNVTIPQGVNVVKLTIKNRN